MASGGGSGASGGTPGLLKPSEIEQLGRIMLLYAGQPAEWTVELAPATVTADRLAVPLDPAPLRVDCKTAVRCHAPVIKPGNPERAQRSAQSLYSRPITTTLRAFAP